ncbi:unnamed protein product [Spirodela intermedia]|uniref:RRM domain-containing protein n=1 Tax=Spirodela intermedia TaxID=51605 RepID=A0A7I8L6F2_SPIIN|nr:unnamed protein product [Spirodela intermedia]
MPRGRASAAATKPAEPVKPVETEEQVDLDEENDPEEEYEEDVEYEEIEEEVEEEVEEEEVEEEEQEDAEEEKEEAAVALTGGDDEMKDDEEEEENEQAEENVEEEVSEEHKELLALPPHGSEVYVGNIPQDVSHDDLKCFCEAIGEVFEVRIMKGKDSAENRGYAFITYRNKELASKAIKDLNGTEFKGKKVKVSASQVKHRLFIGNVPRHWSDDDLKREVRKVGPGVSLVELKKDPQNASRNRGFAFIEYYNNACAEYSRRKMSTPKFKLESNAPTVSWADPKNSDSSSSSNSQNVTQDQVKELFKHHGEISKVVLPPAKSGQENSRFGFVHFAERSMAMKALKNTEKYELEGQVLDCSLAKPPADSKKGDSGSSISQKAPLLPAYPPRAGYGLVNPYGSLPAAYGAGGGGYAQPLMYGREAAAPAGLAMVPMMLPDGRVAYVLQQGGPAAAPPGPLLHQQRGGGGGGDKKGGGGGNPNRGRPGGGGGGGGGGGDRPGQRYRPY